MAMASPQALHEMSQLRYTHPRHEGWRRLVVRARVVARLPARSVSFEPIRSAGTPRLCRALLIQETIWASIVVAVLALAGAGCAAGPTARASRAMRAAASRRLGRARCRDPRDMGCMVTSRVGYVHGTDGMGRWSRCRVAS